MVEYPYKSRHKHLGFKYMGKFFKIVLSHSYSLVCKHFCDKKQGVFFIMLVDPVCVETT